MPLATVTTLSAPLLTQHLESSGPLESLSNQVTEPSLIKSNRPVSVIFMFSLVVVPISHAAFECDIAMQVGVKAIIHEAQKEYCFRK